MDYDDLLISGVERFDSSFSDNGVVLEVDAQSSSPFRHPGVDHEFESYEIVGLNFQMSPILTEGSHRRTHSNLAIACIPYTVTVNRKPGFFRIS